MARKVHYVKWPHEIATFIREGHIFPENRDRTAPYEFALFDAFRRYDRNHGMFEQRREARERVARNEFCRERDLLLDGLYDAQEELHEWYNQRKSQRYSSSMVLWKGVRRQFLEKVSSRMAGYLLRVAPWHAAPDAKFEAHISIEDFCARLCFGSKGYDSLLHEAIDIASKKLRKQGFKVRFHAEHRYQETTEHQCTGGCRMRCYETSDVFNLPPEHKNSRTLVRLTAPEAYLYVPRPYSHKSSKFVMSISFKAA